MFNIYKSYIFSNMLNRSLVRKSSLISGKEKNLCECTYKHIYRKVSIIGTKRDFQDGLLSQIFSSMFLWSFGSDRHPALFVGLL